MFRRLLVETKVATSEALVLVNESATSNIVYFPGDVQDFEDCCDPEFIDWSLERTGDVLVSHYSTSNVFIFRAAYLMQGLADYRNVIGTEDGGTLLRVASLLHAAVQLAGHEHAGDLPLTLLGFSKGTDGGCTVLNRIVADLAVVVRSHETPGAAAATATAAAPAEHQSQPPPSPPDQQQQLQQQQHQQQQPRASRASPPRRRRHSLDAAQHALIERTLHALTAIHWLDAGNMFAGAYPRASTPHDTAPLLQLLRERALQRRPLQLAIHGTPRQLHQRQHAWIAREKEAFVAALAAGGAPVAFRMYFADEPPSLQRHFAVLRAFDTTLGAVEAEQLCDSVIRDAAAAAASAESAADVLAATMSAALGVAATEATPAAIVATDAAAAAAALGCSTVDMSWLPLRTRSQQEHQQREPRKYV